MKAYLSLMRLFLMERFASLRVLLRGQARKNNLAPRSVGKGLLYVGIFVMFAVYLIGFEITLMNGYAAIGAPDMLLSAVLMVSIALTAIVSLFYVLSQLYMSRDVLFLSALPVSSRTLFGARLSMALLGEIGISCALYLPALVLTGMKMGMGVSYYVKGVLLLPFLPVISVCVATLISTLLIRLSALWKRRESLTIIASFVFLIGFMVLQIRMTASMGNAEMSEIAQNIAAAQINVAKTVNSVFPPVQWAYLTLTTGGFAGAGYGLLFAGVSMAAAALVVLGLGGGYQRVAVRQSEALASAGVSRRSRKASPQNQRSPLRALFDREMSEIFRTPVYAINSLSGVVIGPVMLAMIYISVNQSGAQTGDVTAMMASLPEGVLTILLPALMCFIAMVNPATCSAVSREGKMHGFLRTLPVKPSDALLAKWWMGNTIGALVILPSAILIAVVAPSLLIDAALAVLVAALFTGTLNALSILWDAFHPKLDWKTETQAIKQNMNFLSLMGVGFGMILLHGGLFYLLSTTGMNPRPAMLCIAALEAIELPIALRFLMKKGSVAYGRHE